MRQTLPFDSLPGVRGDVGVRRVRIVHAEQVTVALHGEVCFAAGRKLPNFFSSSVLASAFEPALAREAELATPSVAMGCLRRRPRWRVPVLAARAAEKLAQPAPKRSEKRRDARPHTRPRSRFWLGFPVFAPLYGCDTHSHSSEWSH